MHPFRVRWLAAAGLAVLACVATAAPEEAAQHWSRLRFEHRGFALDAALELRREAWPATALPAMEQAPADALRPTGAVLGRLVVESRFRLSPFFSRQREAVLWFDPPTHAALLGLRETTGIGEGYRVSRYAAGGVQVRSASPASAAERKGSPSTWSAFEQSVVGYGPAAAACSAVTEPAALLLFDPGTIRTSAAGLCVISRKHLLRPLFSAPVEAASNARYRLHAGGEGPIEMTTPRVLRYALNSLHVEGSEDVAADESFLGLEGEIVIEVDPATGLPLRLQGRASLLGTVDLQLREAWVQRAAPVRAR